ncbi:hypothetical protein RYX36_007756 [Vicia faba]
MTLIESTPDAGTGALIRQDPLLIPDPEPLFSKCYKPLVLRIFTENSISPGPCRRQRGSRYTIRAGRYLCDKEFRYLRTIRVTAAVYRGFHSKLITLLLPTFQHRAGVRLYTSCYHLAESCVFNKQSLPPVHREDRPSNSKFFPGSFNLIDYDNSRDYKHTRNYGRAACIRSFPGVGKAKWGHPSPLSALPRAIDIMRSTEIDFAENQLYPILVGLSPLATSHPRILPHTWVQSSKASTKMFQFAKFEKSKERILAAELGYGFLIGDPWIKDGYTSGTLHTKPISKKKVNYTQLNL